MRRILVCSWLLVGLMGCGEDVPRGDAGSGDTGAIDAGRGDADGTSDAYPVDACTPSCGARVCGDDGCGGSCGACEGDCSDGVCAVPGGSCPPAGPYGTSAGAIAPDVELFDCDGAPVALHTLCDHDVTWLFEFADWCPPCRSFASSDAEAVYQANAERDFEAYFVVSATRDFGAPSQTTCAEIRDRYGLTMPVLFDPTGALQTGLDIDSNAQNVVFTRGMRIDWVGKYAESEVASRIEAAFSR